MADSTTQKPPLSPDYWEQAKAELSSADPVMAKIIRDYPDGQLECRGAPFETLCRSIVGQQISVKAADSMWAKLEALCTRGQQVEPLVGEAVSSIAQASRPERGEEKNTEIPRSRRGMTYSPDVMLSLSEDELRGCGLSRQKIEYLKNIAEFFNEEDARTHHGHWHAMEDADIIDQLVSIKGVGKWTAEMFLIFHVMHPDVFPVGDIGIQKAIELHYPSPVSNNWDEMGKREKPIMWTQVAKQWQPWRTVASWYLWRSLDPVPVAY